MKNQVSFVRKYVINLKTPFFVGMRSGYLHKFLPISAESETLAWLPSLKSQQWQFGGVKRLAAEGRLI